MRSLFRAPLFLVGLIGSVAVQPATAQTNAGPVDIQPSARLQKIVDGAVAGALKQFAPQNLKANELAITLVDLNDAARPTWAHYRGNERIYPASVIKMFYLVAAHRWMEDGKLKDTEELRRAMKDMIVDSLNEATGYVVDVLTETTSGPELPPAEFDAWFARRQVVNRYFTALGYQNINVNRKTWCEGPYGREKQLANQPPPDHRNWLTTQATARLFTEIVTGRAVTPERCRQMMALHERQPFEPNGNTQSREYTGAVLPAGSKLWSKAGWTSEVRHDAAYVELPTGERFILVTFTVGHSKEKEIVPAVARLVLTGLREVK
ncbi:MAG TPA: serine hydrolase [Verrucomicrobiae bacterium]|nr:serine hydrolase [Verrucomicrobiae bacterium]